MTQTTQNITTPTSGDTPGSFTTTLTAKDGRGVSEPGGAAQLFDTIEKAFDYRGDVTVRLKSDQTITGYIFDRVTGQSLDDSFFRIIPTDSDEIFLVTYVEVACLEFT